LIRSELGWFLGLSAVVGVGACAALAVVGITGGSRHARRVSMVVVSAVLFATVLSLAGLGLVANSARPDPTWRRAPATLATQSRNSTKATTKRRPNCSRLRRMPSSAAIPASAGSWWLRPISFPSCHRTFGRGRTSRQRRRAEQLQQRLRFGRSTQRRSRWSTAQSILQRSRQCRSRSSRWKRYSTISTSG
jgi:hypothetical protein